MPTLTLDWHAIWLTSEKIVLAYILSLPTGWFCEKQGHAVGIRTFPIVAMASCGYLLIVNSMPGSDGMAVPPEY